MRPEKFAFEEEYKKRLKEASFLVLTDYSGLSAGSMDQLRRELEKLEAGYIVVKNRLLQRAIKNVYPDHDFSRPRGPSALAWTKKDAAGLAGILSRFQDQKGSPRVVTAIWEGRRLEAGDVMRLAFLPSRPVLLSQVIAGVQVPITGLVTSLSQILAGLVFVLKAIKEKKSS